MIMKTEKNVNELSGPSEEKLGTVGTHYVFGLDAVQKTMKTQRNANELSDSPRNYS